MWRTVKASRSGDKVTLTFFENGWGFEKRRLHQVTIDESRLVAELTRVGITLPVKYPTPKPLDVQMQEHLDLQNEIAWYAVLKDTSGGRPDAKDQRQKLWRRITRKLNLR